MMTIVGYTPTGMPSGSTKIPGNEIEQFTGSNGAGKSVMTGSGGPWNSIQFNFYNFSGNPYAVPGTDLYLLNASYAGTPEGLVTSPPSSLISVGVPNISDTAYVFPTAVTLQPNTEYYFYTGGPESIALDLYGTTMMDQRYRAYTSLSNDDYQPPVNSSFLFALTGNVVPEPSRIVGILGMAIIGAIGLCFGCARTRQPVTC